MHYSYRIYPLQFQLMYSQMTIYTHRCCPSHNAGCTATFTDTAVNITYEQHTILTGSKDPTSTLWHIPIPEHLPILSPPSASAVQGIAPDAAFVRFAHATFGSRALSTFHKAIRCNYLASFPRLTLKIALAHPVNSTATAQGHLDQKRQGQRSSINQSCCLTQTRSRTRKTTARLTLQQYKLIATMRSPRSSQCQQKHTQT